MDHSSESEQVVKDEKENDSLQKSSSVNHILQVFVHHNGCKFKIRKILGDGNCLFRCMSYLIFGRQGEHEYIRHRVVQYIIGHWRQFQNFKVDEDEETYQLKMSKTGTYGSEAELVAFADAFHIQAIVYFKESPQQDPVAFGRVGTVCFLLYSGPSDHGHYDVLKPVDTIWCNEEQYGLSMARLRSRCKQDLRDDLRNFKGNINLSNNQNGERQSKTQILMIDQLRRLNQGSKDYF